MNEHYTTITTSQYDRQVELNYVTRICVRERGFALTGFIRRYYKPLRDGLQETEGWWEIQTTDPKSLTVSQYSPSLAYVASYSDIEREVLKVTIGRMVTVAHNLHLVDPTLESGASVVTLTSVDSSDFQAKLKGLLNSPEFLP